MLDFQKYVMSRHSIFKIRPRDLHTGLLSWQHFHAPKRDTERNELRLVGLTCRSNGLMCRLWPMKAAIDSRPSAVSLKICLRETTGIRNPPWTPSSGVLPPWHLIMQNTRIHDQLFFS